MRGFENTSIRLYSVIIETTQHPSWGEPWGNADGLKSKAELPVKGQLGFFGWSKKF